MTPSTIFILVSIVIILFWAINTLISRDSKIRKILNVVVVIAVAVSISLFVVF